MACTVGVVDGDERRARIAGGRNRVAGAVRVMPGGRIPALAGGRDRTAGAIGVEDGDERLAALFDTLLVDHFTVPSARFGVGFPAVARENGGRASVGVVGRDGAYFVIRITTATSVGREDRNACCNDGCRKSGKDGFVES